MNRDFDLPGLFRYAWYAVREHVKKRTASACTIVISEENKDEFIYAMRDTRFGRENVVAVPMQLNVAGTPLNIAASEGLEPGIIILEFHS